MCRLVPAATSCVLVIAPRPESLATCLRRSGLSVVAVHPEELSDVVASGNRFSCILLDGLFGMAVERRLHDVRTLLSDGGLLVTSVRNPLHHEYLLSLLRSDLPSGTEPAEGVGYATVTRWLLDAGFMPNVADTLPVAAPAGFHRAAQALLRQAGVHPRMARRYLDSSHLIFTASRREMSTNRFASTPLSFVVCVNDELQLTANLLASPALSHGSPHELIVIRGASSIGDAFNDALFRARNAMVVMVHQDVYLPLGWDTQFLSGLEKARRIYDPLGAVGLFGIRFIGQDRTCHGRVIDRHRFLDMPYPLPARVDASDEILLAFPRDTPLRMDPTLGFHLYGTDVCLQARSRGLNNVAVEAPVFHNSLYFSQPTEAFQVSGRLMLRKWPTVRPLFAPVGPLDVLTATVPGALPIDPTAVLDSRDAEIAHQRARIRQLRRKVKALESLVSAMPSFCIGHYISEETSRPIADCDEASSASPHQVEN